MLVWVGRYGPGDNGNTWDLDLEFKSELRVYPKPTNAPLRDHVPNDSIRWPSSSPRIATLGPKYVLFRYIVP